MALGDRGTLYFPILVRGALFISFELLPSRPLSGGLQFCGIFCTFLFAEHFYFGASSGGGIFEEVFHFRAHSLVLSDISFLNTLCL